MNSEIEQLHIEQDELLQGVMATVEAIELGNMDYAAAKLLKSSTENQRDLASIQNDRVMSLMLNQETENFDEELSLLLNMVFCLGATAPIYRWLTEDDE